MAKPRSRILLKHHHPHLLMIEDEAAIPGH